MSTRRESTRDGRPTGGEFPAAAVPGAAWALGLYVVLTVLMTWPLATHLGDRLPLGNNDLLQNYWNVWWWKQALWEHNQSPYWTHLLYQPGETSLAFHTHSPANMLSLLPIALAWNEAAALNVGTLLGFALSAWGGYLLTRELCRDAGAAFVAGILLAFAPYHFEQSLEHLNLASYQSMPFLALFLIRSLRDGGLRNILTAAFFLALTALYSWHNALLLVPLITLLGASAVCHTRRWTLVLRHLVTIGFAAFLLVLPFLWPLLTQMAAGEHFQKASIAKAIDGAFVLIPAEQHPLWGSAVRGLYENWRTFPSVGFTCYLSVVALALIALGLLRGRRDDDPSVARDKTLGASPRLWFAVFLVYFTLSLGTQLTVAGRDLLGPLPFALFQNVPLLSTLRVANRFSVGTTLATSVLLALALGRLAARPFTLSCCRVPRAVVFTAIAALLIVDLLWLPYPLRELPHPGWLQALHAAPPGLLLNVPGGHRARGAEDMYFQTLHERPLVGGYTSVLPRAMKERVDRLPMLTRLFEGRPQETVDPHEGLRQVFEELPISVVVVHFARQRELLQRLREQHKGTPDVRRYNPEKGIPAAEFERVRAALRELWGAAVYADEAVEIYARP